VPLGNVYYYFKTRKKWRGYVEQRLLQAERCGAPGMRRLSQGEVDRVVQTTADQRQA